MRLATYAEWQIASDDNVLDLFFALREEAEAHTANLDEIAAFAEIDVTTLSHITRDVVKGKRLSRARRHYLKILEFIWVHRKHNFLLPPDADPSYTTTDPVFSALLSFSRVTREEIEYAKKYCIGTYSIFRYSHHLQGTEVLRGVLKIEFNSSTKSVTTKEYYSTKRPGQDDDPGTEFNREGFFVYRTQAPFIFSRKEIAKRDIQTVFFTDISGASEGSGKTLPPTWMEGMVFDWQGSKFYATRVVVKPAEPKASHQDYIGAIPITDVPERVRKRLLAPQYEALPLNSKDPTVLRF